MILVDINLLLYAYFPTYPDHEAARLWLERALNGRARVGLPWATLLGFARIASNPRVFEDAPPITDAWALVQEWLSLDSVWTPTPTQRHAGLVAGLLAARPSHRHATDAHLAALAIEHGLVLCSADADFGRFPGVTWDNPVG